MILGNLYREKGQVGKAITLHQNLLQRPNLSKLEHAYVLLCLGLDYKRGGFVDRALEAFNEVLRLDPKNEYALLNLQKLHEEQHQWTEAYDTRRRLSKLADIDARPQSQAILAFLENEIGLEAVRRKEYADAIRRFEAAIDLDARAVPAYLNLGDVRVTQGNEREAAAVWERLDRGRARSRVPGVRSARGAGDSHRQPGSVPAAVPAADRREPAGLARAARAVAPSGRQRPAARSARPAVRRAGAEPARARHPPGDLARARPAPSSRRARRSLRRADPARGLLSRSARLHALPLPQHGAALAVPALPRLEHVRRGADRAGAGSDGGGGLN